MVYHPNQSSSCGSTSSTFGFQRNFRSGLQPLLPATLLRWPAEMPLLSTDRTSGSAQDRRSSSAAFLIAILESALALVEDVEDEVLPQDE
jgi:hypothetical protein